MTIKRSSPARPPAAARVHPVLEAVRTLYGAIDRFDAATAAALEVDRTAVRALNLLEHGPVSPGRIGEALGLTSGAVTALLHRLESVGYVARVGSDDGRRKDAALTDLGRRRTHAEFARLGQAIAAAFAGQPAAQLEAVAVAITTLAQSFDAAVE